MQVAKIWVHRAELLRLQSDSKTLRDIIFEFFSLRRKAKMYFSPVESLRDLVATRKRIFFFFFEIRNKVRHSAIR